MKRLLLFSFVLMLFVNVIVAEEYNAIEKCRIQPVLLHASINLKDTRYRSRLEGFAQGTLVKTEDGYVAIETLSSGDIVEGKNGNQKIVCAQKQYGPGRIALCINDQYMCVASYQQFCMADSSWKFGCDLRVGDYLYGECCVQAIEFSPEPSVYYTLSTEEHAFFIYPDLYVHNSDFATITAGGGLSLVAGAIEVLNPVTV